MGEWRCTPLPYWVLHCFSRRQQSNKKHTVVITLVHNFPDQTHSVVPLPLMHSHYWHQRLWWVPLVLRVPCCCHYCCWWWRAGKVLVVTLVKGKRKHCLTCCALSVVSLERDGEGEKQREREKEIDQFMMVP